MTNSMARPTALNSGDITTAGKLPTLGKSDSACRRTLVDRFRGWGEVFPNAKANGGWGIVVRVDGSFSGPSETMVRYHARAFHRALGWGAVYSITSSRGWDVVVEVDGVYDSRAKAQATVGSLIEWFRENGLDAKRHWSRAGNDGAVK